MVAKAHYTVAEYYALEHVAEHKSDYWDGQIIPLSGLTARHSTITVNICGEVHRQLKGTPCAAKASDLRLAVPATGLRTYPDLSVYCDKPKLDPEDPHHETYTNPSVVFEVLSESAESYERWTKVQSYRYIETCRAFVFVAQDRPHAEVFQPRDAVSLFMKEYDGLDAVIPLPMIGAELPMREVYDRVDFSAAE